MRRSVVVAVLLVGLGFAWLMGAFAGGDPILATPMPENPMPKGADAVVPSGQDVEGSKRDLVDERVADVSPEPVQVALVLAVVVGRIINTASRPVAGATVQLWSPGDDDRAAKGETEADGTFRIEAKTPGACDLAAFAAAFGFVRREALRVAIGVLDVGDLVLQPKPAVLGRLIYPDGQPIVDMRVQVSKTTGALSRLTTGAFYEAAKTDTNGRFKILNLTEGTYILRLPYFMLRGEKEPERRVATGQAQQELTIARHRIRVRGPGGLGISGWSQKRSQEVQAALRTGHGWSELFKHPDASAAGDYREFLVSYDTWWRLSNSEGDKWREALVHAESVRNETEVDLELLPVELSGTLRLRARAVDGSVPTSAKLTRIYATGLNSPGRYEQATRDGEDFLFRMSPGSYRMRIRLGLGEKGLDDFAPVDQEIHIHETDETLVAVEARSGGRVQVTVHLPDIKKVRWIGGLKITSLGVTGESVALRPYQVNTDKGYSRGSTPSETPIICVYMLRSGRHELTVAAKGYQSQRVTAFVETGKITPVEVWLVR
tara:strand:- start:522 stop:2159 length:1638 start_codon:yes stop_codon:yes gene_type:complete